MLEHWVIWMCREERVKTGINGESYAGVPASLTMSAAGIWMSFQNGRSLNLDIKPEK
jgi:hypothetical protein